MGSGREGWRRERGTGTTEPLAKYTCTKTEGGFAQVLPAELPAERWARRQFVGSC
jgi:hypothetical protein